MVALIWAYLTISNCFAVELRELAIHYKYFHPSSRDPFFQGSGLTLKEELDLVMDIDLGASFYWDNLIEAKTDPGQYRSVAWNFRLGSLVHRGLSIEYEHRSQHMLDQESEYRFPVENSIGLYWTIHRLESPRTELIK